MKLREIVRYELAYQLRRLPTWISFVLLGGVTFLFIRGGALGDATYAEYFLNAPFVIAAATVIGSLFWLVTAAAVTGEVAARDAETGIHPLAYTLPVSKAEYLGGRFLAAWSLNGLIMLAVPLGVLLAVHLPGVDAELVGPFQPAAYLTAYGFLALPNAFVGTAIQFAWAALGRRGILSYLGSVLLLLAAYGSLFAVMYYLENRDIASLLDVFGHIYLTDDLILGWTPIEKNTRLIALEGTLLRSRLVWVLIGMASLAFTHLRFRLAHPTATPWWSGLTRRLEVRAPTPATGDVAKRILGVPHIQGAFGFATSVSQTIALAKTSFLTLALGRGGLVLLTAIAALAVVVLPQNMQNLGTPLLPRTEYVLTFLTAPLTSPFTPWVIIPLLIILYAGELVWRDREAGLGEITDAAPVPEWVLFLGRFIGLALLLAAWMALLTAVGVLIQVRMGYYAFELGLYLKIFFGLQLAEYLVFAALALVVQGLVTQKYLGHLVALIAYASILFASELGIRHHLLLFGSTPAWSYTDMRGFGNSLGPWLWFMLYWAAWALLLTVVARLLWVRGMEKGLRMRLRLARGRLTPLTSRFAAATAVLVLALGGFIFYNTNVRNEYLGASEVAERRAEYERRYARYAAIPQPSLTGLTLEVDIHPARRSAELRGSYRLVNRSAEPIDSVHMAPAPGGDTGPMTFDRAAQLVVSDDDHGHRIYALERPLAPGDSLSLGFRVRIRPRGFRNSGIDPAVTAHSTFFTSERLPAIGYQPVRELLGPGERRRHGLASRPLIPLLAEADAAQDVTGEGPRDMTGGRGVMVETVVSTDGDQVAVAPGALRRSWTEGGRSYFHYATDKPIGNEYRFFSARYAVHEEMWPGPSEPSAKPVAIQAYYHPKHAGNLERMLRSVRASLKHNTRAFGPYPYDHIRLVENPGGGSGAHADPGTIDYTEGFTRFDPAEDPRGLDLPFAVMAHEMAHQWGVPYAYMEGAPLLTESFAWYAAMGVVEETYGLDHLRRLQRFFRQPHPIPPIRQSVPLLRALDPYAAYRKGPSALYALSEYMGAERVNLAFRRLIEAHRPAGAPLATTLDLYRELQAVTPDSLRYLLHDLLAENTYWELETERATARKTGDSGWQVTLNVRARKVAVDSAGVEREVPMDEWVPVGVFAPTEQGADFGEILHLAMHRVRSGERTITVMVPREPSDAGIDPYHLLIEMERFDNVEKVEVEG